MYIYSTGYSQYAVQASLVIKADFPKITIELSTMLKYILLSSFIVILVTNNCGFEFTCHIVYCLSELLGSYNMHLTNVAIVKQCVYN